MTDSNKKNDTPKFIVKLPEPSRSESRHGHALFYFASVVFRAIEAAGGKVEFESKEKPHD
ncbi:MULTISPECIES: hypothetical protein [Pantoea]|uniref:hypothetical protein n=1 Tax=Pantoea TaxID=53335 RepID=UPI0006614239|nr:MULTISPECIES: hypothetical protein [Pantoea]DAL13964.1 MAG TPA_asm: hypothetical protein [Caudoviricetes sp.]